MCQGSTCHVVAQHGDISKLNKALLLTWEVCATIAIKTSKEISQCCSKKHKANKGKPTKATSVTQRFLGHNCLRQRRCVRGHRVRLSHSMEISASLTKLFCWLGKSVQPLPSRHPKRFRNAVPKSTRQTKATFVTQRFLGHNCWLPRCAHVRVPRYMSKRTAAREPWLRSRVRVNVPVF